MYIKIELDKIPGNDGAAAASIGPIMLVRKDVADDKGFIAHEAFHIKMFWTWFLAGVGVGAAVLLLLGLSIVPYAAFLTLGVALRAIAYRVSKKYRLWEEVKAYGIQADVNNLDDAWLKKKAASIVKHYDVGLSEEEVYKRLKDERG